MRVGIAGTGTMGTAHAAAWSKTEATISGFVSLDGAAAEKLAAQYRAVLYPDLPAMLAGVDVVDICTPTHLHCDMVLAAAAAGKDILCEKPLARTLAQGQRMIAACAAAGVKLMVAHVVRFFPEYARAKAQVDSGAVGQPAVLRFTRGTSQPHKALDNWFIDDRKSGGMILDLMIHDLDYARWVAGEVESVFAKKIAVKSGEHSLAILRHAGGAITHVEGSWAYPPPLFRTRFEIAGSNGLIAHDSDHTAAVRLHLHQAQRDTFPGVPLPRSPLDEDPYTTEVKAFYDCLANGTAVPVTGADGLAALQIALAAIDSAAAGKPVRLQTLPEVAAQEVQR